MAETHPPYPTPGITVDRQMSQLIELSCWAESERARLPEAVRESTTQVQLRLGHDAKVASYRIQPVPILWSHYVSMQTIRREWDEAVRCYPYDAWDSSPAVRTRVLLVNAAACLCNNAFLPFEAREARAQRDADAIKRVLMSVLAIFETAQPDTLQTKGQ